MNNRPCATLFGRPLAAVVVFFLALLAPAAAATAHDSLTGSSPADGETLEMMPETVELNFSNPPVELGSEISIQDDAGTEWAEGPVEIVGTTVSQPVKSDAPAGEYTVTWRVVSSDSHPIEGVYSFTASSGASGAGLGTPAPLELASEEPAPEAAETEEAATTFPTSFVVVMVVVLVALVAIIAVLARRRLGGRAGDAGQ